MQCDTIRISDSSHKILTYDQIVDYFDAWFVNCQCARHEKHIGEYMCVLHKSLGCSGRRSIILIVLRCFTERVASGMFGEDVEI
jgi:hypothetical protein